MLDCGGRADVLNEDLLKNLTLISPNETELERLTSIPITDDNIIEVI